MEAKTATPRSTPTVRNWSLAYDRNLPFKYIRHAARRIWLNLEFAKKPIQCLEYIIVHALVHLLERHHNDRFTALMDQFLPHWRVCRDELNQSVLGHDEWTY